MQIRIVGMRMHQRPVPVPVRVRLAAIPREVVLVPVMLVVRVSVLVLERFVRVLMLVALAHVQPDARRHEAAGDPEQRSRVFAEKGECESRAKKRRNREICAGARSSQFAQRDNEKRQADAIAQRAERDRRRRHAERRQRRAGGQRNRKIGAA